MLAWSGIGINVCPTNDNDYNTDVFDAQIDYLLAAGFEHFRVTIIEYDATDAVNFAKAAVLRAIAKGASVTWGLNSGGAITAANWSAQSSAIQAIATWCQDNGVDQLEIGNEDEYRVDGTTMTVAGLISSLKTLATACQSLYTRGPIAYCTSPDFLADWISAGKGDIDKIGVNQYMGGEWGYDASWKTNIDNMIQEWGTDAFLSEWAPSYTNLADYSTNEAVQAAGVSEMLQYIESSGLDRAYYFNFYDDTRPYGPQGFGAKKTSGGPRQLWHTITTSPLPLSFF